MWGIMVNGARMMCVPEKDRVPRYDRVVLRIIIENMASSDGEYEFFSTHPLLDYDAEVKGPNAELVALTAEGEALRNSTRHMVERQIDRHLKPGETFTEYFFVSDWFRMDEVGDYQVAISRKDETGSVLSAEPCVVMRI